MYHSVISGNYINFAICEYYSDDVFTQLSLLTLKMVSACSLSDMHQYGKVELAIYNMVWQFYSHHLELMFMKFDTQLIRAVCKVVIEGLRSDNAETLANATNCTNALCEFVFEKLKRKATQKTEFLI